MGQLLDWPPASRPIPVANHARHNKAVGEQVGGEDKCADNRHSVGFLRAGRRLLPYGFCPHSPDGFAPLSSHGDGTLCNLLFLLQSRLSQCMVGRSSQGPPLGTGQSAPPPRRFPTYHVRQTPPRAEAGSYKS